MPACRPIAAQAAKTGRSVRQGSVAVLLLGDTKMSFRAEGRRLGMTERELFEYLKVEWMDEGELRRLARNVGVKVPSKPRGRRKR